MNNFHTFDNCSLSRAPPQPVVFWNVVICISILIIISNAFLIILIFTQRKLRSRISNVLLVHLFASYIVSSSLILVMKISPTRFRIIHRCIVASTGTMFLAMVLVTLDRFFAIRFPFRYSGKCHWKNILTSSVIIWLPSTLGFLVNLNIDVYQVIFMFTAVLILLIANTYVYCVARRHAKKIRQQLKTPTPLQQDCPDCTRTSSTRTKTSKQRLRVVKSAMGCFSLAFVMILGFLSTCIIKTLYITGTVNQCQYTDMRWLGLPFVVSNGLVCPVICLFFNKDLRGTTLRVLKMIYRGDGNSEGSSSGP
ncbi:5-hydroxytryptamine receptor 7-like [Clytia hemisphaerica]|uniref:5-hydroxytryptamine receptor 7-like n=1 Tax=Clytia hemisphaerica TaxID=252671 RepID=UPI0034D40A4B